MAKPKSVIGWKLDRTERAELLNRFPPRYADTVADHVTLKSDAKGDPLPDPVEAHIIGRSDDGDSLEAMVVAVDGTVDRPDGSIFHITWSLDKAKGRRAKESNELLKERGWEEFDGPIPVEVEPARFP
jgi:hypothetical protein